MDSHAPSAAGETAASPLDADTVGGTTRRSLLLKGSAAALAAAFGATLLDKFVDPAAAHLAPGPATARATGPKNLVRVSAKDSNRMAWDILKVPQIKAEIPYKNLFGPDPDTGMQVFLVRYDAGFMNTAHTHPTGHGFWVIEGILETHSASGRHQHGPGSFVWFPEGGWIEHGAAKETDCTFLFITNKQFGIFYDSDKHPPYPRNAKVKITAKNTNRMPWAILSVPQIKAKIPFKNIYGPNPDTGMQVFLVRYDAGFTNTWHTHPTAHGFWVINGVLETVSAAGRRQHGPGSFVWVPEGGWIEHGAAGKSDCEFLFVTNKQFGIFYEGDANVPYPPN